MRYVWITWSIFILVVWLVLYITRNDFRKVMLGMSLITMPLGLTQPLFVPEYWYPPSLFDLANVFGFDIESLIFSFAIGGIGSVIYQLIFKSKTVMVSMTERSHMRHKLHRFILFIPLLTFVSLELFTNLNPIYSGILGMFSGALSTLYCRPDLSGKIWIGGILFTGLYFIYFGSILPFYPDYVRLYWNLEVLTNILVLGVPLEELLFAFTFGAYWSGLFEHLYWRKLEKVKSEAYIYG